MEEIPNRFWEDLKWGREHHSDLLEYHRNKWVAIVNKKIVSAGSNLEEVENIAREKTGEKHIPTIFIDGGEHIYAN
jgi:glutaredoxin